MTITYICSCIQILNDDYASSLYVIRFLLLRKLPYIIVYINKQVLEIDKKSEMKKTIIIITIIITKLYISML